jgi:hypothetical protein
MKTKLICFLTVTLLAVCTMPVFAEGWDSASLERARDGAGTTLASPLQIPKNIGEEYQNAEFKPFGIIGGTFKGLFYMVKDAGTGIYKAVTFNL